jgi:hypothetical protein
MNKTNTTYNSFFLVIIYFLCMLIGCSSKEDEANKMKEMQKKELAAMDRLEQLEKESEINSKLKDLDINKLKNEKWYVIYFRLNKCTSEIGNLGEYIDNLNSLGKEYKKTDILKIDDIPIIVDLTTDISPSDGPKFKEVTMRYFRGQELCDAELNEINDKKLMEQENNFEDSKRYK